MEHTDFLEIGGKRLGSRLFTGTGKYGCDALIAPVCEASGSEVITVALRRVDLDGKADNVMKHIPSRMTLLPNTSGARNADEAVRIARLARAMGCGDWIKIEVISDNRYLLPDGYETAKATEILAKDGFVVLPYMNPDLYVARSLADAGAAAIMPLGAPIGTNRGLKTEEMIRIEQFFHPFPAGFHPTGKDKDSPAYIMGNPVDIGNPVLHGGQEISEITELIAFIAAIKFIPKDNRDLSSGHCRPHRFNGRIDLLG